MPNKVEKMIAEYELDECSTALLSLKTSYLREQYLKQEFNYVEPTEVVMNKDDVKKGHKKEVYHYIDIKRSLKNLIEDQTFQNAIKSRPDEPSKDDDVISDVKDGRMRQNIAFFKENKGAFTGMLYSDAIELVSPLGAGKGRQKVIQVFFTLAEIPPHLRSKIDWPLLDIKAHQ